MRSLQPATSLSKTFAEPYFLAHRALRGIFNLKHIIAQIFEGVKEEYSTQIISLPKIFCSRFFDLRSTSSSIYPCTLIKANVIATKSSVYPKTGIKSGKISI